jgi:hypothetical protein
MMFDDGVLLPPKLRDMISVLTGMNSNLYFPITYRHLISNLGTRLWEMISRFGGSNVINWLSSFETSYGTQGLRMAESIQLDTSKMHTFDHSHLWPESLSIGQVAEREQTYPPRFVPSKS